MRGGGQVVRLSDKHAQLDENIYVQAFVSQLLILIGLLLYYACNDMPGKLYFLSLL